MSLNFAASAVSRSTKIRRYAECMVLVLVWMAFGSFFHLGGNNYLLLGVPLVIVFQLVVARRPLSKLWVRDAKSFRLDRGTILLASALILVPAWAWFSEGKPYGIMFLAIAAGAVPCAFALRQQNLSRLFSATPGFVAALIVGCGWFAFVTIAGGASAHSPAIPTNRIPILLSDFFCMTLAGFVVEEVAFRGAIDSHVVSPQGTRLDNFFSAIFVSLLWGVYHLPLVFLYPSREMRFVGVALLINILWGVPLSFCGRKSGTLLLPSAAHALCDAYRNVLSM